MCTAKNAQAFRKNEAISSSAATKVAAKPRKATEAAKAEPVTTQPVARKQNKYTHAWRGFSPACIEKVTKGGKATFKDTLDQTDLLQFEDCYGKTTATPPPGYLRANPAPLAALEAKNFKLLKVLAGELRAENAEPRIRLDMV
ncbi:hypothetical protein [Brucella cytisi]|uniref:Uncharacterized protein n=1 Tax=Brucella cytisi TaxID=407152 RepID=A0A1J6HMH3_9HYPH|nr:hypothetical protein [Brucella cytisi]OIS93587.1 hypothetical protein BLA27_09715 [Brucella cytisi]